MTSSAPRSRAWHIPPPLARLASRLPQFPHSAALAAALDLAIRDKLDPEALARLEGKVVRLEVRDAGIVFSVACRGRLFHPVWRAARADVTISASAGDLVALAMREEDPDTLFFLRRLSMEGDTELGLVVKNMLEAIDLVSAFALSRAARVNRP